MSSDEDSELYSAGRADTSYASSEDMTDGEVFSNSETDPDDPDDLGDSTDDSEDISDTDIIVDGKYNIITSYYYY